MSYRGHTIFFVQAAAHTFALSTTCITDPSRLLADLSLRNYHPDQLRIAFPPNYPQTKGESPPGVSGKQAEKPKPMDNQISLPPGIYKLLHLWDPITSDSSYGWGELAERLIQLTGDLGPDNEVPPSDEASPDPFEGRFGIPIPRAREIHFLDDNQDARELMKYVLHENLHSRRRIITGNSASTAGSRPSPMIVGPSDPFASEPQ